MQLGDFIELKRGYDLPKKQRSIGKFPLVSSAGISDYHNEAKVRGPGVVTGRYGTIGEVFFIKEDFWPLNTTLYVRDFKGNNPRFAYYVLKTIDYLQYSDKAAVPGVNRNHLHMVNISVPTSIAEQKRIALILAMLDDKIQLNRQINQTLEQMAQAIFKSWFVDFEPVKAKIAAIEQGEDPLRAAMRTISGKTDTELDQMPREHYDQLATAAALFPDAMEESELGEIPVGWGVKAISDIANFATGKIETATLSVDNYISTENMRENRGGVSGATSLPAVSTVPGFLKGQVLISNIRPYFKKIWFARFDGGRSNDVLCFEAKEENCQEFLYNLLYQDEFFEFMMRTSKGAKMPRGDKKAIAGWTFPCANRELRAAFSEKVQSFYSYIETLNMKTQNLSDIRNTLLPKLLSGELLTDLLSKVSTS